MASAAGGAPAFDLGPASEVLAGRLFLGCAQNAREVAKGTNPHGITHVLNVSDGLVLGPGEVNGLATEWVPIADDGEDPVFAPAQSEAEYEAAVTADPGARPQGAWWRCEAFLRGALEAPHGARVLVHCALGVNRSATIVVAWLMASQRWDRQRALKYVQRRRPLVNPVPRHLEQLEAFQAELGIVASPSRCALQ
mmetsp:Transcript_109368/g.304267  ORF Transcript_109368/g.304267 Transcript_109368/m.304267 type:complete len:195 (+) Transcript_109368:39-623(+)